MGSYVMYCTRKCIKDCLRRYKKWSVIWGGGGGGGGRGCGGGGGRMVGGGTDGRRCATQIAKSEVFILMYYLKLY